MKRIAIFPGTFDPFTLGHADVAIRGSEIFDEVIVAIGNNSQKKQRYIAAENMVDKINECFSNHPRIHAEIFTGLTAKFAESRNAKYILRGLRNTTDFEYENSIAQVNRHIFHQIETVFIITSPQYAHISSTIIREIHRYGQNVDEFLPYKL
jgi:pantetheine-phosphate adenylyltransferase